MSSGRDDAFGAAVVGFFIGIGMFFKGFKTLKRKRLMEGTPTSKVRSLAMGFVEVYGEALPAEGKLLKSPFSGQDCFYYHYTIEEQRRSKNRTYWHTVKKESLGVNFYLQDDTGKVVVNPFKANADIPSDYTYRSNSGNLPTQRIQDFLKEKGVKYKGFLGFNKTMRYTEYFIAPHDKVYILGTAGDNPHVDEATAVEGVEDVMIQKGNKGSIYYISDKSEKECIKSHSWSVIWQIYGGAALNVACLAYILWKLQVF